jgi:hypothetical protein
MTSRSFFRERAASLRALEKKNQVSLYKSLKWTSDGNPQQCPMTQFLVEQVK